MLLIPPADAGVSAASPPDLTIATLVSGLTIPWDVAFTPDGTMLFTQRGGVLSSRLSDGTVQTVTADFSDLFASRETGLMGIVVDPNFASNRRFYTCQGHTGPEVQVIAWTINSAYTAATRVADPLVGGIPASNGSHGGCRLRFGPDGYLWIATGDAATGTVPQDLTSLGGKVLRVNASTGAGAPANPFASNQNTNAKRVYTYGHRNVQGLALRPGTSQMWSVEHGPSVDDEVNLLAAGGNYGWNPVPGYNEGVPMTDLTEFPAAIEAKWSSGSTTLAASGAIFLEGDQWGIWEGRLAVATLKDRQLRVFEFDTDGTFESQAVVTELDGVFGRLRTPMMGPDGALYVTTSSGGSADRILRIAANNLPSAPAITSITRGDRTLAVVWTAPADTGGGVITAYDVRYIETSEDETDDANWTVWDNAWRSGDLRYVISNLTNATEYDVQVRAVNSAGDGEWSDTETGTPLPDDIPITLQWEETSLEVAEDAGSVVLRAVFTTTLDAAPVVDFTFDVTLTTTDTGTTKDDDYTAPPSSATFVASDFSQTDVNGQQRYRATRDFTVVITDDTADESDEAFRVTLAYSTPGLTHLRGGPSTAVVTIKDNEHVPVTLSWEQSDTTVGENAGSATLRAYAVTTVDKRPEDGFSFDASVYTSDGSAAQPGDYTQVNDTVTFSRNDFSRATVNGERRYRAVKQVRVTIQDDISDEDEEDFTATIDYANPGPLHLQGGPASMSVKITDNDFVPVTISWDQSFVSVDEDATTVTLQARATTTSDRMPESGITVALSATTAGDTATQGSDYRRLTSSFSFRQGDFTRTDVGGQFRFQATRDVSVSIIDDTVDEPDEDFTATLSYSNPSLPHLQGGPDTATVTIADNDHVPVTLGWEETAFTAEEPTSPGTTTSVTLRAAAVTATDKRPESGFAFDFTVNTVDGAARQPADYEQLSATETFDRNDFSRATVDGQSRWVASADFAVNVEHDTVDEPIERFTVRLAFVGSRQPHLTLGDSTATVTITDDIASLADLRTTVRARAGTVERASN